MSTSAQNVAKHLWVGMKQGCLHGVQDAFGIRGVKNERFYYKIEKCYRWRDLFG